MVIGSIWLQLSAGRIDMQREPYPSQIREHIEQCPWFADLPLDALNQLAASARWKSFEKESFLYTPGVHTSTLFCVLEGCVRIGITSAQGQEFAMVDLHDGAWIGETFLANDEVRVLDARVIEDALVLMLPKSTVLAVADRYPGMYKNLFLSHVNTTRGIYDILGGMLLPLRARLAGRLLQLSRDHGIATDEGIRLNVKLSQKDFASLCVGSRQRVNKILREWSEQGIISFQSGTYLIRNLDLLQSENNSTRQN